MEGLLSMQQNRRIPWLRFLKPFLACMYPSIPSYPWHSATLVSDKNIVKETNHHHHHCHFHHHRLQIILGPLTMSWVVSSVIITHQPQYTGWEPLCSTYTHIHSTHTHSYRQLWNILSQSRETAKHSTQAVCHITGLPSTHHTQRSAPQWRALSFHTTLTASNSPHHPALYTNTHAHTHKHTHIYTHTYTNTRTHTQTNSLSFHTTPWVW